MRDPRWPQLGPKKAEGEAKMAQHRARVWRLHPKATESKNNKNPKEKHCFSRVQGLPGGPRWNKKGPKLGQVGAGLAPGFGHVGHRSATSSPTPIIFAPRPGPGPLDPGRPGPRTPRAPQIALPPGPRWKKNKQI